MIRIRTVAATFAAASLMLPGLAQAAEVKLTSSLTGAAETAGGQPGGTGDFAATVDADSGDFCYTLTVDKVPDVTMAHVHTGKAGVDGAPVINLEVTKDGEECIAVAPETLAAIVAAPGDYYVNVHNKAYPKGAARGQLAK